MGVAVSGALTLVVSSDPTIEAFTVSPGTIALGQNATFDIIAAGGTGSLRYAYFGLPGGCTSGNSRQLACTPTVAGPFNVTAGLTDQAGVNATAEVTLVIVPPLPASAAATSSPWLYAGMAIIVGAAVASAIALHRRRAPPRGVATEPDESGESPDDDLSSSN